jgi:two-component system sensor histidine kinase KdpD
LPDETILYLYVIVVTAILYSWGPAIVAAVLSVLAYDFFFVPPIFEFNLADIHYTFTFSMMLALGLVVAQLASRIRRDRRISIERERRTAALFALTRSLGSATDELQVVRLLVRQTAAAFGGDAALLMPDPSQCLRVIASQGNVPSEPSEQQAITWAYEQAQSAGCGTANHSTARFTYVPVVASGTSIGVLAAEHTPKLDLGLELREMLESFGRLGGVSIAGLRLAEAVTAAELRAQTESIRSALLSAVSHDLRTPLAVITEAATMLRDDGELLSQEQRVEMVVAVCEEAERMDHRVGNLLDMTRLESGGMSIRREWVPCDELIGAALHIVKSKVAHLTVRNHIPADLPPISVDAPLIEQLLANLFENIVKYAGPRATVDVEARQDEDGLVIEIADDGPGIPAGIEERIFEKFFRASPSKAGGTGLGLAICRAIIEIHGGTITAGNRPEGGALFRVKIPSIGAPPELPVEPDVLGDPSA